LFTTFRQEFKNSKEEESKERSKQQTASYYCLPEPVNTSDFHISMISTIAGELQCVE
jgi:hypothetical protein